MAYATVADLGDNPPANAQLLLDRASRDVDAALLTAVYDPDHPDVVAALKEATLEQVRANLEHGDKTGLGAKAKGGFSIGRITVQASAAAAGPGGPVKVGRLWEQAHQVLVGAGLTGHAPWTC